MEGLLMCYGSKGGTLYLFEIFIIIMSLYQSIPLQRWQQLAHNVCSSTNPQTKQQAEQFFYLLVQSPPLDLLLHLFQIGSDLLLFALFSYLSKYPQNITRSLQHFTRIMEVISRWKMQECGFLREGKNKMAGFVVRTIFLAIGTWMKWLYQNAETNNQLLKFVQDMPIGFFKIMVLKNFIQVVQVVDTQMGYMRFRTMVYAFQDNVIPLICDNLMPFFYSFQQTLKITQLSQLQSRLNVAQSSQQPSSSSPQFSTLTPQQEMQSSTSLNLLKKIVEFNYNITYTQYQSEQVIDTCLITYPDRVLEKIINFQFMNSLFYVVEKVMECKVGDKRRQYLGIVLQCLAKIMQARLGYVAQQQKSKFIATGVRGLTHLLQICQQLQNQQLLQGILLCNKKLLMSVELSYIQKVTEKDPELNSQQLFKVYIRDLSWMLVHIFKNSFITVDNNLLQQSMQVLGKLCGHLGYKQLNQMCQDNNQFYYQLLRQSVNVIVTRMCLPMPIFSSTQLLHLPQNKQSLNSMLQLFKKLSSHVYSSLFTVIQNKITEYQQKTQHTQGHLVIFANLLLLLSQIVDRHFLERAYGNTSKAKDQQLLVLAGSIRNITSMVRQYVVNRAVNVQISGSKQAHYLDIGVLLFIQAILMQFLGSFESSPTCIHIKQKLYLFMVHGNTYSEENPPTQPQHQSEDTICHYLNLLFTYLSQEPSITQDAEIKLLYALEIVEKVVYRLKWNMRRESFLRGRIFACLMGFFQKYFMVCPNIPQLMVKVGKITVTLTFDDVLDQYKFRIKTFLSQLTTHPHPPITIFYLLMGVFQGIQPGNICRYFCLNLKQKLNLPHFFKQIFKMAYTANNDKQYKDVCKMCRLVIMNKGLKNNGNAKLGYQMVVMVLPELDRFIGRVNQNWNDSSGNVDLLCDAFGEIIQMFSGIVNGTHINVFLLDQTNANTTNNTSLPLCKSFTLNFLTLMTNLHPILPHYPKLQQQSLSCSLSITKQILQYIYNQSDSHLSHQYNIFIMIQIDRLIQFVILLLNGNRLVQEKLVKIVDAIRMVEGFVNRKREILHQKMVREHLQEYCLMMQGKIIVPIPQQQDNNTINRAQKLVFHSVTLILTSYRNNLSYIRSFGKLLYQLNKRYQSYFIQTLYKINMSPQNIQKAEELLRIIDKEPEEDFVEMFKKWIKDIDQFK